METKRQTIDMKWQIEACNIRQMEISCDLRILLGAVGDKIFSIF